MPEGKEYSLANPDEIVYLWFSDQGDFMWGTETPDDWEITYWTMKNGEYIWDVDE